jgi:serine/threonine protein phosphatase PrpC
MATVFQTSDIQADDYFFLCSDGVLECVDDETLCSIVCPQGSDEDKCSQIARLCEQSKDNNTAYLIHIASVDATEDDMERQALETADDRLYTEHETVVTRCHRTSTIDVQADDPETSLTDDILNFIKKIFH